MEDVKIFLKKKRTKSEKRIETNKNLSEKEKEKENKSHCHRERNKNLPKEEKEKKIEYMRNYYLVHKK